MRRFLSNRKGAALVEFAIVGLLICTLLFGVIEFGLVIRDSLTLNRAVTEGVRDAVIGDTLAGVQDTVSKSAIGLTAANIGNVTCSYRVEAVGATVWPAWPATPNGVPPTPPPDGKIQVMVSAQYAHTMLSGGLFGNAPIMLNASKVMRLK